jgi:hypothetical protein
VRRGGASVSILSGHAEARGVHHDEHVFEAVVRLTDEIAGRPAVFPVVERARRVTVDAQLVLGACGIDVVGFTQAAVGVDERFRGVCKMATRLTACRQK